MYSVLIILILRRSFTLKKMPRHRSVFYFSILLAFALIFCCSTVGYANFQLDPDFGKNGKTTTDFNLSNECVMSMAIDSQNRLVVAGYTYKGKKSELSVACLACYKSDGTLDTSFGTNGTIINDFGVSNFCAYSLAIDSQNRLMVAGYSYEGENYDSPLACLKCYKSDGTLDTSFGTNGTISNAFGVANSCAYSVAIDSEGRIVLAGRADKAFALARYTSNGAPDTSFNLTGSVTTSFKSSKGDYGYSVAIDSEGRIVVAGESDYNEDNYIFAFARYTNEGKLDMSFNETGMVTTDFGSGYSSINEVLIDSMDRIMVVGRSQNKGYDNFALARYTNEGTLDKSFGKNNNGMVTTGFGLGNDAGNFLAMDVQGRLLVAGRSFQGDVKKDDFALARYSTDGILDTTFGKNGTMTTDFGSGYDSANSLKIDSTGRLIVAGYGYNGTDYDLALAGYKDVTGTSAGGGCNIPSMSYLGFLLAIPFMLFSKKRK